MNKKGKLIIIDGVDGSGKATQTEILYEKLKSLDKKVKKIDFPRYYDNFFGKLIGECLAGEHGDFLNLDAKIASVLYACDRFEAGKQIKEWLDKGYVVLSDRYVSSNYIHQAGKMGNKKERLKYLRWLEKMEYQVFETPRPDLIIYLDVPYEVSEKLAMKKTTKKRYLKGKKDVHESDKKHIETAIKSASDLLGLGAMQRVDCVRNGEILSKEEISRMVWGVLGREID